MDTRKVKVPREVAEELEEVRKSGVVNMFDRRGVILVANMMQNDEAAIWAQEQDNATWGRLIMYGPDVVEE